MQTLFLIVFVDLVGFGLLLPLLPFYVQRVGAEPAVITFVLGLYSLAQFVAAPVWGRLSDRYGRKPILAVTSFGLGLSYLLLAAADSLALLVASRLFGGLMAGNIAAAQAYVADVTTPQTRARGMGILGAAFGLGFIFGPALGGILGGHDLATANFVAPALAAMALSFAASASVVLFLKESVGAQARAETAQELRAPLSEKLRAAAARPVLALLALTGFLTVTAWAQFETVFALWANVLFRYGPHQVGLWLGFIGLISVVVQGVLIGRLTRRFGEQRLAMAALLLLVAGYVVLAESTAPLGLGIACALLALGSALFNPAVSSLVSQTADAGRRGAVMGVYQSASALGRVAGPAFSGALFSAIGPRTPFLVAAGLLVPALACLALAVRRIPAKSQ